MFQLLQPIWLCLIAGIVIPVMIHLWNIRPGKSLPVGSIILLKENGRQSSRRIKLSDLLLLLLRCLLIILLAILLARPVWRPLAPRGEKGWVLLEKDRLQETYRQFQPRIDALLQAGYTFHYFNPGFPEGALQAALQETGETAADSLSYWTLLDSLQHHAGAPPSLFLFTTNYMGRFRGPRPKIDTGIHWYAYTPIDSVTTWWADAYATPSGSIRARKVTSRAAGNSYVYEERPAGNAPVKADTTTKRITIFAGTYAHDAGYLKAALTAIQQFTQRKIQVTVAGTPAALPIQADWLFWLSMQPVPEHLSAKHIWSYDSGKVVNASSWIISEAAAPMPLYKQVQVPHPAAGQILWKDGYGNAVLRYQAAGNTHRYYFSSRLDPAWNELPWNAGFPVLLLQLLFPDSSTPSADKDRRAIAAQQLRPDHYHPGVSRKSAPATTDLAPVFWAVVFVLFLAERFWAFRKDKLPADG